VIAVVYISLFIALYIAVCLFTICCAIWDLMATRLNKHYTTATTTVIELLSEKHVSALCLSTYCFCAFGKSRSLAQKVTRKWISLAHGHLASYTLIDYVVLHKWIVLVTRIWRTCVYFHVLQQSNATSISVYINLIVFRSPAVPVCLSTCFCLSL